MAYLIQAPLSVFYNVLGIQPGVILSAVGDICCLNLEDDKEASIVKPMRRRLEAPRVVETYEQGAALTRVRGKSVLVEEKIWESRSADRPSRPSSRRQDEEGAKVVKSASKSSRSRKPALAAAAWTKHSLGAVVESDEYDEEEDSTEESLKRSATIDKESISSTISAPSLKKPLSSSLLHDDFTTSSPLSKPRCPRFKLRSLTLPSTLSRSRSPSSQEQLSPPSSPTLAAVHVSFSTPLSTLSATSSSTDSTDSRSDSSSTGSQHSLPRRIRNRTRSLSSALKSHLLPSAGAPRREIPQFTDLSAGTTKINSKLTLLGKRARSSSCESERSGLMRLVRREAVLRSKFAVSI